MKLRKEYNRNEIQIGIIGNKLDDKEHKVIGENEGNEVAKEYKAIYMETSAKTGENIEEVFQCLIDSVMESKMFTSNQSNENGI